MLVHHQAPIYRKLLEDIEPGVTALEHTPVLYLALNGVGTNLFTKLLAWVRSSVERRENLSDEVGRTVLEARLWGVSCPGSDQIRGFLQTYAELAGQPMSELELASIAKRALIKTSGVLQLEANLQKAVKVLDSINPPAIWESQSIRTGAREAGERYVRAVAQFIPSSYREVSAHLAAIAWNRDHASQDSGRAVAPAMTSAELLRLTVSAAISNRASAAERPGLEKEMRICTDVRAKATQVKQSANKIFGMLKLEKDRPHRRFLEAVVEGASASTSGSDLLAAAWRTIAREFDDNTLSDLSWLEANVLQFTRPTDVMPEGRSDASSRDILSRCLGIYRRAALGCIPLQVTGAQGILRARRANNQGVAPIDAARVASLVSLSEILAGIPWSEKQKLREVCP